MFKEIKKNITSIFNTIDELLINHQLIRLCHVKHRLHIL